MHQNAKVKIELENGTTAEFVAQLEIKEIKNVKWIRPDQYNDNIWQRQRLPDPPEWEFHGNTYGHQVKVLIKS